ncbi:sigma-54 dependent transcriptional regulator, partial [Myxococcota bacterium]|nr:sigma-54 dependent transcriptional regulator [Myxococcota bacterium]
MDSSSARILIVDDAPEICRCLKRHFEQKGFKVRTSQSSEGAKKALLDEPVDVLIADFFLGEDTSEALTREAVDEHRASVAFCMTGAATPKAIVAAMRAGCSDVIEKPFDFDRIDDLLAPWTVTSREDDLDTWRRTYAPEILGSSAALLDQLEIVRAVADIDTTVLVTGETGTGKELIARALHEASPRRNGPFVAVNCAAIPESMIEDELFGHTRGSFTGATGERSGRILSADGGTLFLDEIGDMPLAAQAKLLRVLQDRVVVQVGSDRAIPFDVRVVAATNRDLEAMVDAGTFRGDLLYRLSVMTVALPALRERPEDIVTLAEAFIEQTNRKTGRTVQGLDDSAAQWLVEQTWPGNIRGLSNAIERAVILKRTGVLSARDFLSRTARAPSTPRPQAQLVALAAQVSRDVSELPTRAPVAPAAV